MWKAKSGLAYACMSYVLLVIGGCEWKLNLGQINTPEIRFVVGEAKGKLGPEGVSMTVKNLFAENKTKVPGWDIAEAGIRLYVDRNGDNKCVCPPDVCLTEKMVKGGPGIKRLGISDISISSSLAPGDRVVCEMYAKTVNNKSFSSTQLVTKKK